MLSPAGFHARGGPKDYTYPETGVSRCVARSGFSARDTGQESITWAPSERDHSRSTRSRIVHSPLMTGSHSRWLALVLLAAWLRVSGVPDLALTPRRPEARRRHLRTLQRTASKPPSSISVKVVHLAQFAHGSVAMNAAAAADLGARPGDQLLLFMRQRRFRLRLAVIVDNGGLAGATAQLLPPLAQMQAMTTEYNAIDRVLVVNRGADDAAAAANSAGATADLYAAAPSNFEVDEAKAEGLRAAAQAQEIFTRIFTLFALFATGVGLLLVFLVFSLLAACRWPEMGIGRVVGMTWGDLIVMYLFEGTVYVIAATGLGVALGLGIGATIIAVLNRILDNYGFTLTFVVHHRFVILAHGLSMLATWLTAGIACWWVTRLTITSAIRDLLEPAEGAPGPWRLLQYSFWHLRGVFRTSRRVYLPLSLVRWLTADTPIRLLTIAIVLCAAGPGLLILEGSPWQEAGRPIRLRHSPWALPSPASACPSVCARSCACCACLCTALTSLPSRLVACSS
jgi:hypothetical protein